MPSLTTTALRCQSSPPLWIARRSCKTSSLSLVSTVVPLQAMAIGAATAAAQEPPLQHWAATAWTSRMLHHQQGAHTTLAYTRSWRRAGTTTIRLGRYSWPGRNKCRIRGSTPRASTVPTRRALGISTSCHAWFIATQDTCQCLMLVPPRELQTLSKTETKCTLSDPPTQSWSPCASPTSQLN